MSEYDTSAPRLSPRPAPRDDLDDLIFQEEAWLTSDR